MIVFTLPRLTYCQPVFRKLNTEKEHTDTHIQPALGNPLK